MGECGECESEMCVLGSIVLVEERLGRNGQDPSEFVKSEEIPIFRFLLRAKSQQCHSID